MSRFRSADATSTTQQNAWSRQQVRDCAKQVRTKYRLGRADGAWAYMHQDHRQAVVAREALLLILGQVAKTVMVEDVRALYAAVLNELGME